MNRPETTHCPVAVSCDQASSISSQDNARQCVDEESTEKKIYARILSSSALIGGSSLVVVVIGMVRTKVMAILLGPAGVGLNGLYGSIADLAGSIATMGVNSSGVRQMAEAAGTCETDRLARTATVLKRVSVVLGLIGAGLLVALSERLSALTFADGEHTGSIALLSFAVFFACLSGGQGALIQGMRRLSDLARMSVLGSALGMVISVLMVGFLGEQGIAPAIVLASATGAIISWRYASKVSLPKISMTSAQVRREARALLSLGFAFMASGLMTTGTAYLIRLVLMREAGADSAGLYQSAWTLGGLYVGFVLQAMGTDFYPRLTGIAKDNTACNQMVNQQTHISLLLAGPGVIATLTFAPLAIALFYSSHFYGAIDTLRWICLGMALRVISWPMGFIILAKGAQALFFWAELAWTLVYLALVWACVQLFGTQGAGIAFFGSHVFHVLLISLVARNLSGFRWLPANRRAILLFLGVIAAVFCGFYILPIPVGVAVGTFGVALSSAYSIRSLISLISYDQIPKPILKLLLRLRIVRLDVRLAPGDDSGEVDGRKAVIPTKCHSDSGATHFPAQLMGEMPSPKGISKTNTGKSVP